MNAQEMPLILMADDDEDDCTLARDAWKDSGAPGKIECVEDGFELMEFLSRSDPLPDLILLDLNMPAKDGRQALREIKAEPEYRSIPIVILTTSREKEDMAHMIGLGASAFITKPSAFGLWVGMMKGLADQWLEHKDS